MEIKERCNEVDRDLNKISITIKEQLYRIKCDEVSEQYRKIEILLEEKLKDFREINKLKDEVNRLQDLLIDNGIKFR